MDSSQQMVNLLTDLISKWEKFANESGPGEETGGNLGYNHGVAMGLGTAAQELKTLLEQAGIAPQQVRTSTQPAPSANTEYYYIGFGKAPDGTWRVKHLNGVWQPDWENGADFNDMVANLSQEGWKLAHFGTDLHVFQRPKQVSPAS